jgi:c-di-GMP-binding flagellar brake protein YcgR
MPQKRTTRRSERRRSGRADAKLSMRVEGRHTEGDSTQVVTESQNISASGVYCTSTHYLAPLSKVALTIVLPKLPGASSSKELIKCDGIVVRCEPAGARRADKKFELACMFSELDERRRGLLEEFVTWRNLQSLRAATAGPNGTRPRTKAAPARKTTARKAVSRRRTIH